MYSQVVKPQSLSNIVGFSLVVGVVIGTWLLGNVCQAIGAMLSFAYGSYFAIIPLFFIAKYIMDNILREYHYTVSQGSLYIERVLGQRTKVLAQVNIASIKSLRTGDDKRAWLRCVVNRADARTYVLTFSQGEQTKTIVFQPDSKLCEALKSC